MRRQLSTVAAGTASASASSATMASEWGAPCCVPRSKRARCAPAMTGESTSVSSDTGAKSIVPFDSPIFVSAVANDQPPGRRRRGRTTSAEARAPFG